MGRRDDTCITRNKFEAYLKSTKPYGYRKYLEVKKKALKKGEEPMRAFKKVVEKTLKDGYRKSIEFWLMAIGKRLVTPDEEEVDFLRAVLAEEGIDLDLLVEEFDDRKKIADVICALKKNIDKLKNAGHSSVYMIVDKLISAKGLGKTPPSVHGRTFLDDVPEELIEDNPEAFEILKKHEIDKYQAAFDEDFDKTYDELQRKIDKETRPTRKALFRAIQQYFKELREIKIPGVVELIEDPETGEIVHFPATHQKIGAMFIVKEKRVLIADEMGLGKTAQAVIAKNLIDAEEGRKTTAVAVIPNNILINGQWKRQIRLWNTEKKSIVTIRSSNKERALKKIEDERPDFVLVSYDMVFRKSNGGTVGDRLANVCDYLILDEVHNAKRTSPRKLRSQQVTDMSMAAEYVAMLSGTPVPNRITDLGVVASILWNHTFTTEKFNQDYKKNPRIVRNYLVPKMLRRRKEQTFFARRKCSLEFVKVPMIPEQQRINDLLNLDPGDIGSSFKLINELRKCALDPRLVGIKHESPKYEKLHEMLVDHYDENDRTPAVVFSSVLKEGILNRLRADLKEYGFKVARIDGDQIRSGKRRAKILDDFENGKYDVLVATAKTMGEGIDQLTVAHRGYVIDVPFTYAALEQMVKRLDRKGQTHDVSFHVMVSEDSIDERLIELIEQKKRLSEMLIDGIELTDYEQKLFQEKAQRLVNTGKDPLRKVYDFFGAITNRKTDDVIRRLNEDDTGEKLAALQWENFEGSFYGNTMNLVTQVINSMEKTSGKIEKILDLASGPCLLARALERPVVSLDANKSALALGKEKLGSKAGECIAGSFTQLPFSDPVFELVVFSLGLGHSVPSEREGIFKEINKSMKKDGMLIVTLPSGEGRYERLAKVLTLLGFDIVKDLTGTARSANGKDYECVIITAKKIGDPEYVNIPVELLDFSEDKFATEAWQASVVNKIRRKTCFEFEIDEVSIEDAVKQAAKPPEKEITPEPAEVSDVAEDVQPAEEEEAEPEAAANEGSTAEEETELPPDTTDFVADVYPRKTEQEAETEAAADEGGPKEVKKEIDLPPEALEDPVGYLTKKYGGPGGVRDNCPAELLEMLGVRFYVEGSGAKVTLCVGIKEEEKMKRDHKRFVMNHKPPKQTKRSGGRRRHH